jgi:hypothetical protein
MTVLPINAFKKILEILELRISDTVSLIYKLKINIILVTEKIHSKRRTKDIKRLEACKQIIK